MTLDARILIVTDGKMGDLAQCRGVAQALSAGDNIYEYVVNSRGFWALPLPMMPVAPQERRSKIFDNPLPDIVIASGRRTVPYIKAFASQKKADRPFTVFLKDPRHSHGRVDFLWAPEHDGLEGENVFTTLTAPHVISEAMMDDIHEVAKSEIAVEGDIVGVILGGDSGQVKWTPETSSRFIQELQHIPDSETLVVVSSRRTPDVLREAMEAAFPDAIWPERDNIDRPYLKLLSMARRLVITGDSHNMVSEALATGAAVHVFRPPGLHRKLVRFLDRLEEQGSIANISTGFERQRQVPLNATPDIAVEIERRFLLTRG